MGRKPFKGYTECVAQPVDFSKGLLIPVFKLLVREVIGRKWLQHENILPFVGVTPDLAIVSDLMEHGNIMEFITRHPHRNRLHLVSNAKACNVLV